ncbi:MAG: CotH kinase family protein [Bacteroidales bacterium]|nr:CotH kinase family protein [Bacteroidales bacterium]
MKVITLIIVFCLAMPAQSQTITGFGFPGEATGLSKNLNGVIDHEKYTITVTTQEWIENISQLPATFTLDGNYEVKVGSIVQESGITTNDFRKNVIYTVGGHVQYTVIFESPQASGLPIIRINTQNAVSITSKENYVNMTFNLTDPNNSGNNISKTDFKDGVRGRGNDSWINPNSLKKSYRVKFDKKTSLFGLARAKSWVLIAQYRDPTLLFNVIAFELGSRFELPFNHSYNFVELYLNGKYKGNYLLTEQNQVGEGRVDIDENEGWFVEMDDYYDEEPKFRTEKYNLPVMVKSPEIEPSQISNPAYHFVRNDINQLCNLMTTAEFPENGYRDLINMNTFIDFLMITEIVDNKEIRSPMSTYVYKDKGSTINMGPLWDFDCGYGYDYNYNHFKDPNSRTPMQSFFRRFFEDPVFLMKYKERWNEKHSDIASIDNFIEMTANKIERSAIENFKTWWYRVISSWWTTRYPTEDNNFRQQIANIKSYLNAHISYLNAEINKAEVLPGSKSFQTQEFGTEVASQTFTLVAYGDISGLNAKLEKGELSDFEISSNLAKEATGNGGYFATISIKPKDLLFVATYTDVLTLAGNNQGNPFSMKIPLRFTVVKANPAIIPMELYANRGQLLASVELPDGWKWENETALVGNVGQQTHKARFTPDDTDNYNILRGVDLIVTVSDITSSGEILQANQLKAWVRNGLLSVTGLIPNEILSIYTTTGARVYHSIVTSDKADISLKVQGVYIISSGNHTIKVVYE